VKPLAGAEPPEGAVMQARPDELYEVGTLGSVVRMLKLGDASVRVMVHGLERARFVEIDPAEHCLVAGFETLASTGPEDARTEARKRTVQAPFSREIDNAPPWGEEAHEVLSGTTGGSTRPGCTPRRRRSPTASSSGCARCRCSRPSTTWRAPTSRCSPRSRGTAPPRTAST